MVGGVMAILLRYNGQRDDGYSNLGGLSVGDIVKVIKVHRFRIFPATVYLTKNLRDEDWNFGADLNCFDYVPKNSPEYKQCMRENTQHG